MFFEYGLDWMMIIEILNYNWWGNCMNKNYYCMLL